MQLRRLIPAWLCLLAVVVAAASLNAQPGVPAFELQGSVSGVTDTKFPHLAVDAAGVHLAANSNRAAASYWSKGELAAAYGPSTSLGPAEGQPDYSTASIAAGQDGALHYVWVNQPTRTIYLRSRPRGGAWGPTRIVAAGQPFPVHPEVAVTTAGALFVAWRTPDQPFVSRRSLDGGQTWSGTVPLSERAGVGAAALAAGPGGELAAAYTGGESDRLQVYLATWDGAAFSRRRLTGLSGNYADPSLSYTPDGRLLVAWRGVADTGAGSGVFYAEGKPDGSFPQARLAGGRVAGRVSLSSDAGGNLHMLWTAAVGATYQLWYAVKPAGAAWSQPVAAPTVGGELFNAYGVGALGADGAAYAHAASELFSGAGVALRHYRFRAGLAGAPAVSARPLIEQGAARSRAGSFRVDFLDILGEPAELRSSWGAAPTGAGGWQPFVPSISLPAPERADAEACAEAALYTQVRAGGATQTGALSDTITIDTAVQARVSANHPDAAPGYTDEPAIELLVEDAGECSGLAGVRDLAAGAGLVALDGGLPATVALDLPDAEGRHERALELLDGLGNTRVVSISVVYDRTDPVSVYPQPLAVAPDPHATVLQTISLTGATYSDGDGALPWAAAVVVSRAPLAGAPPSWTVVPLRAGHVAWAVDAEGQSPTLSADLAINLATLLPREQLTPGVYHYALALLDHAGNATAAIATGQLELEAVTYPTVYAPALVR